MVPNDHKKTCLLFPKEKGFITVLEVGLRQGSPGNNLKSPRMLLEMTSQTKTRLGSKAQLLAKPLQPSVLRISTATPIIRRNYYRNAMAELGLYLLLASEPALQNTKSETFPSTEDFDGSDESETSISFSDGLPPHLYTPRRLPMIQIVKNWWRYR
ncbi:hypothetical protein PCANC_00807 [Puccinia coronata f. sp. avenae]|jgi:hypothetical protein|uniref:Uncharacterized protein n=1 Tax=Puccinia coronata f. sp. avenae TaxID=200324 RepID=A0A2N5W7T7_9BASI|nr:hypothetical protein PCANC_00807 [Puccinia coronata f. sp. avenae]